MRRAFLIIIGTILLLAVLIAYFALMGMPFDRMTFCISAKDCVPVYCQCHCSGCGGFSGNTVVNRWSQGAWYLQQGCQPALICPMMCCPPKTIACEHNHCTIKGGT